MNTEKDYKEIITQFCKAVGHENKSFWLYDKLVRQYKPFKLIGGDQEYFAALVDYYKETVVPHKVAVFQQGIEMMESFKCNGDIVVELLLQHDLSKFSINEMAYSEMDFENFDSNSNRTKMRFKSAWHHHKMHNPHHPEYWFDVKKDGKTLPLEMPRKFVAEMVADWRGAGVTYGNPIEKWLSDNLENFRFHRRTAMLLANILSKYLGIETVFHDDSYEILSIR